MSKSVGLSARNGVSKRSHCSDSSSIPERTPDGEYNKISLGMALSVLLVGAGAGWGGRRNT